jgi:(p)ppGpp synthase/HD superfamily hydrolase
MERHPQTYMQLFNLLQRESYGIDDLACVRAAYELAMRLFTGFFIGSGRTQIAHVVGAAGILASLRAPAEVVAAALIHNAYENGDFGDGTRGATEPRRKEVKHSVGSDVEEHVYRFAALRWDLKTIPAIPDRVDSLDAIDRGALLIRLADQLEHHRDLGGFYYHAGVERCRSFVEVSGNSIVETAEKLGFPALATELRRVFRETLEADVSPEMPRRRHLGLVPPQSYRMRMPLRLRQKLARELRVLRWALLSPE